jgi:steroid delta-isomerase-like uncharacterized protein
MTTRRQMLESARRALAAWNRGDPDGVVADMADDVIWRDVALGMPLQGRPALRQATKAYMAAFPDMRVEMNSSTIEWPRMVQEWTSTGTHRGELMGLPPTGRWTETYGALVTICDDDGWIIEGSVYWNPLALFRQLGFEPPLATVSA